MCVMGNQGTVLEHVLLLAGLEWALDQVEGIEGPVQYVDTHAMAPFGVPRDPSFNLIGRLLDAPAGCHSSPAALVRYEAALYLSRQLRRSTAAVYPTHFVHAACTVQSRGRSFEALLFENDFQTCSEHGSARDAINAFVCDAAAQRLAGLDPARSRISLAELPGNFRDDWQPRQVTPSAPLLAMMSDPHTYEHGKRARMERSDLALLRHRLDSSGYSDFPLVIHVLFLTGNLGADRHEAFAGEAADQWRDNFVPSSARSVLRAVTKWGGFMAFFGAYSTENRSDDWACSGARLFGDVDQTLATLHRSPSQPTTWVFQ